MMQRLGTLLTIIVLLGAVCTSALAQWPTDPSINLLLSDANGDATTPIVKATSDGGCFVLYYDNTSGNYDVYLQRVDPDGNAAWEDGLLVSNHPMTSYVTVWGFGVDANDNAILATNDIRDGDDWDIYAYSVSPEGNFNWGANGITLSNNTDIDAVQKMCGTTDGGAVFVWYTAGDAGVYVNVQKINQDGTNTFAPFTITADTPVERPDVVPTSDGGFIVLYIVRASSNMYAASYLYAQRYSSSGTPMWGENGVAIDTDGGISRYSYPALVADGADGAVFYWYASVGNVNHVFAQRVNGEGTVLWNNGSPVRASTNDAQAETSPAIAYEPGSGYTYLFYPITNTGQTLSGLGAQLLLGDGDRSWGDSGITLISLGDGGQSYLLSANMFPTGYAVVTYLQYQPNSAVNALTKSICVDDEGSTVWETSPTVLCTVESDKGRLTTDVTPNGQVLATWSDGRNGNDDLYLQNVNPDGSFGPYSTATIVIDSPSDGDEINYLPLSVEYTVTGFVVAESGGDGQVRVIIDGETTTSEFFTAAEVITVEGLEVGENDITLQLVDYEGNQIEPPAVDHVTIHYVPPSIEITSPQSGTNVIDPYVEVEFTVSGFTLGLEGYLEVTLNGIDPWYLSENEPVGVGGLWEGENTITLQLVDHGHIPLDPVASASVIVNYVDPTLVITSPENGSQVSEPSVQVVFEVTDFVPGVTGDGYISVSLNEGEPIYLDSTDPYTVTGLINDENLIELELVTYNHQPRNPAVTAEVTVIYVNAVGENGLLPGEYALSNPWPNPFNPSTTIQYAMKETGRIHLEVTDVLGRQVAVLADGVAEAGVHTITWNAAGMPSGLYFVRMTTQGFTANEKLILMK